MGREYEEKNHESDHLGTTRKISDEGSRSSPSQAGRSFVRIRRVGICGTDLHAFKGEQPYFTYPRILGHELAGEIMEVDENPHGLKAGYPVVVIP